MNARTFTRASTSRTTVVSLGINPDWRPDGSEKNPASRLIADPGITVCGVNMHVMAYEVKYDNGVQTIADPYFLEEWEAICRLYDYCFETMHRDGREYVIVAHPHGD